MVKSSGQAYRKETELRSGSEAMRSTRPWRQQNLLESEARSADDAVVDDERQRAPNFSGISTMYKSSRAEGRCRLRVAHGPRMFAVDRKLSYAATLIERSAKEKPTGKKRFAKAELR
jgi:hypothetical protein